MRLIRIILLALISGHLYCQDSIEHKGSNYFVFNADFSYRMYKGNRTVEITSPSVTSVYTLFTIENTTGYSGSVTYRYFITPVSSFQYGLGFRYSISRYVHNDSNTSSTGSPLKESVENKYNLEIPLYYGCTINRFTILAGFIVPLGAYHYNALNYEDGSSVNQDKVRSLGSLYLSGRLQFIVSKRPWIGFSFGGDVIPDIFFKKTGYKSSLHGGFVWMLAKQKKVREPTETDYIK